ncbi:MAG: hypothetical protein ACRD0H_13250 [Actinomycetes bacterium]
MRSILRRCALLVGAVLAVTSLQVGSAQAASIPPREITCTVWSNVPFKDVNDGWSNDRHMRVQAQTQKCKPSTSTVWTTYARAHLMHVSADTWKDYPFDHLDVRIYRNNGCIGCEVLVNSGPRPEPGVGKDYFTERVALTAGQKYGVLLGIYYKKAPTGWFQTAHHAWTA